MRSSILFPLFLWLALACVVTNVQGSEGQAINQHESCGPLSSSPTISPVEVDSPVVDLRWIFPGEKAAKHEVDKVVLALTAGSHSLLGGRIYRSAEYGKPNTWKIIDEELRAALTEEERSAISPDAHELDIIDLHFRHESPHRMLLQGAGPYHWTTRDYGRAFRKVPSPGGVPGPNIRFRLHPTNPEYVLARVRSEGCGKASKDSECSVDLYVSTDFGESWTSLKANAKGRVSTFVDFDWAANLRADPAEANYRDETIFATIYEGDVKAPSGSWDERINFVRSDDFFASDFETNVKCGNAFEIAAGKIFLAVPSDCPWDSTGAKVPEGSRGPGDNAVVYVSEDYGETFAESCVPVKHLADKGYELRETHDKKGVYVLIDHDEEEMVESEAPVYNLYTCGAANATLFTLSLERVFSVNYFGIRLADWHRVEALPGIFITNQLEKGALTEKTAQEHNWQDFVESQITFNGGGHWQHLQAPDKFRRDECNLCTDTTNCHLHLHGASSWIGGSGGRPSVYSHASAPGIVMASGNTGNHLDWSPEYQCTWLSRDGGFTWEDVARGMFIYEYGDHGGLILMARHRNQGLPTNTLFYSHDQGLCWSSIHLSEALYLENIRVEPQGASHIFILHGEQCERVSDLTSQGFNCTYDTRAGAGSRKGVMYVIDFEEIHPEWSHCLSQDYEDWSPPVPELCLLGQNLTIERRKRGATCFNARGYERTKGSVQCACSQEDTECDYGFYRPDYHGICEMLEDISHQRSCPALEEGYKMSASHMRIIHGDQCADPRNLIPDMHDVPVHFGGDHHRSGRHRSGFGHFLLICLLLVLSFGLVFGLWFKFMASEDKRDTVVEVCGPVISFFRSLFGLCCDCFGRPRAANMGAAEYDAYFQPLAEEDGLTLDEHEARSPSLVKTDHTM
uniref:Oligoxyloglucan reducing end-specific cellobiohydrolase n=1 Tax=Tetraselmis sp. GSL018 TaxID=582737 RepID=A0A061QZD8_9CHLO|mmetsp:Transcript_12172/g.28878  ORF Transcript_12172/g.28878 Transcript_12172/m.28878 type:complete len:909 (+) Transcript_12172:224-2950(+)|eukprot:CAMPEP_0177610210 /NCGR_PEP_ID=MMETSP0419_2-20121207/19631_1 /TAXON_ID=582737 /ORGANISM="Tetraselmis sp., Strain GSL018" /LENGTH=908 /DNA_ID=CAMNT_0019105447 /DNA_START=602 /DNA_END=3328 /DNA_ORIENTATION=+